MFALSENMNTFVSQRHMITHHCSHGDVPTAVTSKIQQ